MNVFLVLEAGAELRGEGDYLFYALDAGEVACIERERLTEFLAGACPEHLVVKTAAVGAGAFSGAALKEPQRVLAFAGGDELREALLDGDA